jgi:hypothetical protein
LVNPLDQVGGDDRALTAAEAEFLDLLLRGRPRLDAWRHSGAGRIPWLIVSLDISKDGKILHTLRLDFDGSTILGGQSPAALNWDSGVRAGAAGIDTSLPDGISADGTPTELAALAAHWFDMHACG